MTRSVRSLAPWGALLFCLLAAGCGARTATVSGSVTYRGKPVTAGSVVLYCPDKQIVRGLIGPDGRYSIPNVPVGPGAAVVTVQSHAKLSGGMRMAQRLPKSDGGPVPPAADPADAKHVPLPTRYTLPEESGLSVVVGGGAVTYDIELKP